MTTFQANVLSVRTAIAALCASAFAIPTFADDLTPPPWDRLGAPNYTVALEWEFLADGGSSPYAADATSFTMYDGDGFTVPEPSSVLPSGNISWNSYDGDGGWTGGVGGGALNFRVANWVDTEPIKYVRVQITYDRGAAGLDPYISFIIANDIADPDPVETFIGATDGPIASDPAGRFHRLEEWTITPNPDFESIQIVVPEGVTIDQVVIDTISTVPEPTSLSLLALGGVLLSRRRRLGKPRLFRWPGPPVVLDLFQERLHRLDRVRVLLGQVPALAQIVFEVVELDG